VAGRGGRLDPAPFQQHGQRQAHEAKRGLRVVSQPQLVVVRPDQQVAEVDIGAGRAAIAQLGDLGIGEELGAHAGVLRALAWEQKRDLRHGLARPSP